MNTNTFFYENKSKTNRYFGNEIGQFCPNQLVLILEMGLLMELRILIIIGTIIVLKARLVYINATSLDC